MRPGCTAVVVVVVVSAAEATSATRRPLYPAVCQIVVPIPVDCVDDAGIEEFMINDFNERETSKLESLPVISTDCRGTSFALVK